MHFQVRGRGLKPKLVEQAIRLSHEKYCSASIMLGKTAEITEGYEIVEELPPA
jgi:putative redox protein